MNAAPAPGQIVILNGAPRSGKSSVAEAIQQSFDGVWMNLGVDSWGMATPARYRPGIGLRPGGERPELEPLVPVLYAALYEGIAANSRCGLNVVVDIGHHDHYSQPLGILPDCARRLAGLPVLFVGVRCPLDVILERRSHVHPGRESLYVTAPAGAAVPAPILLWQQAVHEPGIYDLEIDTEALDPAACAAKIRARLDAPAPGPSAFERLAAQR